MVNVRLVHSNGEITDEVLGGNYRPLYVYKPFYTGKALANPDSLELPEGYVKLIKFIYQGESNGKHVYIQIEEIV